MTSYETFLQATLNRLTARLEGKIETISEKLSEITKNGPNKFKQEWELFQEEVTEEANRIEELKSDKGRHKNSSIDELLFEMEDITLTQGMITFYASAS